MADIVRITPLKAFSDNYIWVLHDDRAAIVVDPGDAAPVQQFLAQAQLALQAIWITHHHHDHIGGLPALHAQWPDCPVYGPAGVSGVSVPVMEGSQLPALGLACQVYEVPGHTANHLAFHCGQHLFCGDTLFAAGCGRVFDGSIESLHASLQRLAALPPQTLCYPAHEYTLANLQFALALEPDNPALQQRWQRDSARREQDLPTLPCLLADELQHNPFLRCGEAGIRRAAHHHQPDGGNDVLGVFATLRQWKNDFRVS
ncbi:hydroxyacylglutathione hydrolase [Vogesella sp. LYT5W]|uniref:Hydroxyacylglutathione hydrolase n=1 Tax=Vogesella margarita TaxID=2984199 RepID=A0ABT5IRY8_9NEIS|nr:hydroxyacylglutathione hydrolase [Vogesella margarita]MDC7714963.1 hydroxyacylglutathione hydrolase [Vogesella margarita]